MSSTAGSTAAARAMYEQRTACAPAEHGAILMRIAGLGLCYEGSLTLARDSESAGGYGWEESPAMMLSTWDHERRDQMNLARRMGGPLCCRRRRFDPQRLS